MKQIPNHERYFVNKSGGVFRLLKDGSYKRLHPEVTNGYDRVRLDGKDIYVHKIMCTLYHPNHLPDENVVIHIDTDLQNNAADNLMWVTPSDAKHLSTLNAETRKRYLPNSLGILRNAGFIVI